MTCANCKNVVTVSKDNNVTRWIEWRGLGFCKVLSWQLSGQIKRSVLVSLNNAAGPLCAGKHYLGAE